MGNETKLARPSTEDWRDEALSGRDQFHCVFHNGLFSDVDIIVGGVDTADVDKKRFPSHSLVLKVRSKVFEKILDKVKEENGCKKITIEGFPAHSVDLFLQFLYIDELRTKDTDEILKILHLAKNYKVQGLVCKCVDELKQLLSAQNAASIYKGSKKLNEDELQKFSMSIIQSNASEVLQSHGFAQLDQSCVSDILGNDDLDISEIDLFHGVLRWVKSECERHRIGYTPKQMRLVLKEALYKIRFPLIPRSDFENIVIPSGILNDQEISSIKDWMEKTSDREPEKACLFPTGQRLSISKENWNLRRTDRENHKLLAKYALEAAKASGTSSTSIDGLKSVTVSNVVVEIEPVDNNMDMEQLIAAVMSIQKYGLYWGAHEVSKKGTLLISFAADERRSYGVGSVIEDIQDYLSNLVKFTYAKSYKDDIQVHL